MELQEQIGRQRVKHIVDSYQLAGDDADSFTKQLDHCFNIYPAPLIELAIAEILVDTWLTLSECRGSIFIRAVQDRLQSWSGQTEVATITPSQFQQITGLDPAPVFTVASNSTPPTHPHHCL